MLRWYERLNEWGNRSVRNQMVISVGGFTAFLIAGLVMMAVLGAMGFRGG